MIWTPHFHASNSKQPREMGMPSRGNWGSTGRRCRDLPQEAEWFNKQSADFKELPVIKLHCSKVHRVQDMNTNEFNPGKSQSLIGLPFPIQADHKGGITRNRWVSQWTSPEMCWRSSDNLHYTAECWKPLSLSMFNGPEWVGLFCTRDVWLCKPLTANRVSVNIFTFYLDVCCCTLQNCCVENFGFVLLTHSEMSSHLYIAHLLHHLCEMNPVK